MINEVEVRIYMRHVRAANMCSSGTRDFCKRHGINWTEFLKNGVPAKVFADTGDAMALQIVKVAENGR